MNEIWQLLQERIELLFEKRIESIAALKRKLFVKTLQEGVEKRGQLQFQRP